jgi:hypothetical protein
MISARLTSTIPSSPSPASDFESIQAEEHEVVQMLETVRGRVQHARTRGVSVPALVAEARALDARLLAVRQRLAEAEAVRYDAHIREHEQQLVGDQAALRRALADVVRSLAPVKLQEVRSIMTRCRDHENALEILQDAFRRVSSLPGVTNVAPDLAAAHLVFLLSRAAQAVEAARRYAREGGIV